MKAQLDVAKDSASAEQYLARILQYPWSRISEDLDTYGATVLPELLSARECAVASALFTDRTLPVTSQIEEQRTWGNGDYRYFRYPLPCLVGGLRTALYPHLVSIADAWNNRMDMAERFPSTHQEYLAACHRAGQKISTSTLIHHETGQQTLLHQDIYGDRAFPLQVAIVLSQRGTDYTGGEFVIAEQRPRMQTRPEVVALNRGDAVVFAVSNRPVNGTRGSYRVNLRHGFSKVREGQQQVLSIIFHDAAA